MTYANDFDALHYATTATVFSPSSTSLSSAVLLPREIVSSILVSNGMSTAMKLPSTYIFSTATFTSSGANTSPICAGHGFDSAATGIIATVVIPSAIGLFLWVGDLVHLTFTHHSGFHVLLHSSYSPY